MEIENYEDGGYYAIKGFEYQIDKAIVEILDSENEAISIENIQDINSDSFVIQVKYKESKKFVPSLVKKPVIQLIDEFVKFPEKEYYLYSFFGDLNGYDDFSEENKKITVENLDKILGKEKNNFDSNTKSSFINNFYLDFSPEFQKQFNDVISKLKELYFINSYDEAIFYYSSISDFLRKLVVNNKDKENRSCTKKEILMYLENGRNIIFNSSFRDYKGDLNYFKYIRKKYFTYRNIDYIERFIVFELSGNEKVSEIKDIVLKIKSKFYKKNNNRSIKSGAPYIFFLNISDDILKNIKTSLFIDGHIFRDGHDFYNSDFSLNKLKEKSTIENNISLKFLNLEDNFKKILNESLGNTKEVYQFFITNPVIIKYDIKVINIQIKKIQDINNII